LGTIQREIKKRKRKKIKREKIGKKEKEVKKENKENSLTHIEIYSENVNDQILKPKPLKENIQNNEVPTIKEEKISYEMENEILSENEILILSILDFIENQKIGISISVFQIKDFLEQIFPNINIDEIYFQLKEKELITENRDSEVFYLTPKGNEIISKQFISLRNIFPKIVAKLEYLLEKNRLLKQILYFSYKDNWIIRREIPKFINRFNEIEQILIIFLLNGSFLEIPEVSRLIRRLRKELPSQIKEIFLNYCKDIDFLKALAILNFELIKEKIGIETIASFYYDNNFFNILTEIVEKEKAENILQELFLFGLIEFDNLFDLDIKSILLNKNNISKLKKWLSFDKNRFKKKLERDWNFFIIVKTILENSRPSNFDDLIKTKAVLFNKENVQVRSEVKVVFNKIYEKIKEKISNKLKGIENVLILPFYEIEYNKELNEVKGKLIIVLHAYNWWTRKSFNYAFNEYVLENNVILLISPKEIGYNLDKEKLYSYKKEFLELPDKNIEFNAIGKLNNLERVKSIFNSCEWVLEEEYYPVKKAKELIWERNHPPISLEEALEKLSGDFKLIELLYLIADKHTGITAIKDRKYYKESHLWSDVWENMKLRYPELTREDFNELKNQLIYIVQKLTRKNLLLDFFHNEKKFIYEHFKDEFNKIIIQRIKKMEDESKQAIYIFLNMIPKSSNNIKDDSWLRKFNAAYEFLFKKEFDGILGDLLIKCGIASRGTYFSSNLYNPNKDFFDYHFILYLSEIKKDILKILEDRLDIKLPDLEIFQNKFRENIYELIALDYILQNDGDCLKNELKDLLWNIAPKAWNEFESYEGVITSKDGEFIILNPFILDKLREFINTRKREMIEKQKRLKEVILSLEIIDSLIELDEDLVILKGFITLRNKEEIRIILAPWYLPVYEEYFGEKTLIIIFSQPDYETFRDNIKIMDKEITLIFFKDDINFYLYSNFKDINFINVLLSKLEEFGFTLISKEIKSDSIVQEIPEEPSIKNEVGESDLKIKKVEVASVEDVNTDIISAVQNITEESSIDDTSITLNSSIGDDGYFSEEHLDIFGEIFIVKNNGFPMGLSVEKPIILILSKITKNDDYCASLQIICRELYRELKRGLPEPQILTEERIEEDTDVDNKIIFIDDDKAKEFGLGKISNGGIIWKNFGKKLQEFYSRDFGFYIFEIPNNKIDKFIEKLKESVKNLRPIIIQIIPKLVGEDLYLESLNNRDEIFDIVNIKKKICSAIWGFVIPENDDRWIYSKTFDNFFTSCEDEYHKRLRDLYNKKIIIENEKYLVETIVERSKGKESEIHYLIKTFTTKYLYEIEKYEKESVNIEKSYNSGLKPDIWTNNIIYEIETLYNSGKPMNKIVEKVREYRGKNVKIIIILKNLDVFLYYKRLVSLEKNLKDKEGFDVEFKTLDLKNNKLIHIKEIGKYIFNILSNLNSI